MCCSLICGLLAIMPLAIALLRMELGSLNLGTSFLHEQTHSFLRTPRVYLVLHMSLHAQIPKTMEHQRVTMQMGITIGKTSNELAAL